MKIGIVGAGLIGGSVILALKGKGYDITVVTGNQKTLEILKNTGITASDEMNSLKGCDVIFVCTPMNKTLDILDSLESIAEKNTIVADVASLKGFVMAKKRPFKHFARFLPVRAFFRPFPCLRRFRILQIRFIPATAAPDR